jgi:hypothetical protein
MPLYAFGVIQGKMGKRERGEECKRRTVLPIQACSFLPLFIPLWALLIGIILERYGIRPYPYQELNTHHQPR